MVNTYEVQVTWGDCDPAGIVFYPNYFAWLNAATDALFTSVGLPLELAIRRHAIVGWPMVDAGASFKAPARFGEVLRIESRLEALGRSSFEIHHRVFKTDGTLLIEARDIRVWAANEEGRLTGRRIPDEVRALFAAG